MTTSYEEVVEYDAFYTSSKVFVLWRKFIVQATRNLCSTITGGRRPNIFTRNNIN
jgi:hypothetical protein